MAIDLEVSARIPATGGGRPSEHVLAVAALFGVEAEAATEEVLFERVRLVLEPGDVVLITGPSGSGKSTLLRALRRAISTVAVGLTLFDLGGVALPEAKALVDCFDRPLEETLRCLSLAGLSEARLLLRAPARLSEGQQFRFRLAQFLASDADVLFADEFCAALDRVTARVVAWQLGRFVRRSVETARPRMAIVATSHGDLVEDLRPSILIHKGFGTDISVTRSCAPQ